MPDRTRACRAAAGVVLALWGDWVAHTLEHLRLLGMSGLGDELRSPVHGYMIPAGLFVAGLAALGGATVHRVVTRLGHRVDQARAAVASAWRGATAPALPRPSPAQPPSRSGTAVAATLALALTQLLFYLVQENIEAAAAGRPGPWWTPVSGPHWAAPLVHLVVACLIVAATAPLWRRARALRRAAWRWERLWAALARRLGRLASCPVAQRSAPRPPLEVFGAQLWSRPPPGALSPC